MDEYKNKKSSEELTDDALDAVAGDSTRLPSFVASDLPPEQHTQCDRCHGTFSPDMVTEHMTTIGNQWLCPACVQAYKDAGLYVCPYIRGWQWGQEV